MGFFWHGAKDLAAVLEATPSHDCSPARRPCDGSEKKESLSRVVYVGQPAWRRAKFAREQLQPCRKPFLVKPLGCLLIRPISRSEVMVLVEVNGRYLSLPKCVAKQGRKGCECMVVVETFKGFLSIPAASSFYLDTSSAGST